MVERVKYTTRLGELSWVFITGKGKRNYNGDGDIYSATLTLSGEAARETVKDIEAFYEDNKVKGLNKGSMGYYHPYVLDKNGDKKPLKDADGDVIEGKWEQDKDLVCVTFKTGTVWPDGKMKVIKTMNAAGKEVSLGESRVGNGSTGCLAGQMSMFERPKDQGVTFYLNSVQIVSLVAFESGDKFEEHEGGFEGVDASSGIPVENLAANEVVEEEPKKTASPRL